MLLPYTDRELLMSGVFEYIKAGFTYPEAVKFAGLNARQFEVNMDDLDLRCHILACSMTLEAYRGRHRREFLKIIDMLSGGLICRLTSSKEE